MLTADFDYHLPEERIAQIPVEPRHAARLLDTRDLSDHLFLDLPRLLRPGDLVVVNRTRVRAARLLGHKAGTGGRIEALLLRRLDDERWEAVVRPARRLRTGTQLDFEGVAAVIEEVGGGIARLRLQGEQAMARAGQVPLPPYIKAALPHSERYQTIFASAPGSAAAPTAALHFTHEVVSALADRQIDVTEVLLHIGLDTFRPISSARVEEHDIHTEEWELSEEAARAIKGCREREGRVIAIGTTVVRTLETAASSEGLVAAGSGQTSLFIRPGYQFRVTDGLVTNFHLPRTTLLVLLAAFMGAGWRQAYQTALARDYRFASFGDAMYAERGP